MLATTKGVLGLRLKEQIGGTQGFGLPCCALWQQRRASLCFPSAQHVPPVMARRREAAGMKNMVWGK